VAEVQTHLEPLERTLLASPADERADGSLRQDIERLVRERTGRDPLRVSLLSTDGGRVIFITLGVPAGESLADAHALAGQLEEELRQEIAGVVDVVIHTEP
jgi:divalent metal cation (Fe/Co/Zn/Cd) transporter